uniref:Protein TEX261 n=1 Tax=Parastrongyloides trichosuri TaxID=131310 RepID=A0A0N4ZQL1_PARTI
MCLKWNKSFPTQLPYGVIINFRMVLSIACILGNYFTYQCEYVKLFLVPNVAFASWSIISFFAHALDLQKNLSTNPDVYFYIPFAIIDFSIGLFGTIYYGLQSIFVISCFLEPMSFYDDSKIIQLLILFPVSFAPTFAVAWIHALFCILIFVKKLNLKELPIKEMVIEGDTISYMIPNLNSDKETIFSID